MLIYSIIITIFLILYVIFQKIKSCKAKKLNRLFYEDFFNLVPQFNENDFLGFIKENTFIINVRNNRFDERFTQIPNERNFLKLFKKSLPKDVNIHYNNMDSELSFVVSFNCDESVIIESLKTITDLYPTIFFGVSQCLSKEMIFASIKNNFNDGKKEILSSKYSGNAKKASSMGIFNRKNIYRFDVSENSVLSKTNIETEAKLITAFNHKRMAELMDVIQSAYDDSNTYSQCMYITNNLLFLLHNLLIKNNISVDDVYGHNVNLYRWAAGTVHKKGLVEAIQNWYKKAVLYIEEHSEKDNDIELKIEKYIEENYSNDISIATMAEEFNVSTQYFSKYFKSQTGNNFLETLNKYRIKKALELLNDTQLTMTDIASMTGFNNYKSFARNFKKYTNQIPSEYTKK